MKQLVKHNTKKVKIKDIQIDENSRWRDYELHDLMTSIKDNGLLQPVGVKAVNGRYRLVYGHRRLGACRKLGHKEIDAVALDEKLTDQDTMIVNLIENIQRKELSPPEEGRYFALLKKQFDMTDQEVAVRVGIPKSRVIKAIRFHEMTPAPLKKRTIYRAAGGKRKKPDGMVGATITQTILSQERSGLLSRKEVEKVFDAAAKGKLKHGEIRPTARLISQGYSVSSAIKKSGQTTHLYKLCLNFKKDKLGKLIQKHGRPGLTKLLVSQLKKKKEIRDCFL